MIRKWFPFVLIYILHRIPAFLEMGVVNEIIMQAVIKHDPLCALALMVPKCN